MTEFKIGDRLKCVDTNLVAKLLNTEDVYSVAGYNRRLLLIEGIPNFNGHEDIGFYPKRFVLCNDGPW